MKDKHKKSILVAITVLIVGFTLGVAYHSICQMPALRQLTNISYVQEMNDLTRLYHVRYPALMDLTMYFPMA